MNKIEVINEIKSFLDGYNNDSEFKYIVNVECDTKFNYATCIIHEPGCKPEIRNIQYTPFIYMKDLKRFGKFLYRGDAELDECKQLLYGIKITKLETGKQKRLVDGYCYKIESSKSLDAIYSYLSDGGLDPWERKKNESGIFIKDNNGRYVNPNREYFYSVTPQEQFFISTKSRLYKGVNEYKDIHRLTFDIETNGLRYNLNSIFAIGVRDNRGFEKILECEKLNDPDSERKLLQEFFKIILELKPAIIAGYNSENFDFEFILGRCAVLGLDLREFNTTLLDGVTIQRKSNTSVKYGNNSDKYTATKIWGISVIDILHAAKRTAAINTDIKETKLKYITKHEKISKPNRTYIKGDDNGIGKMYSENKMFCSDADNNYIEIPSEYQDISRILYALKFYLDKNKITKEEYLKRRNDEIVKKPDFIQWFKDVPQKEGKTLFTNGRKLLRQYLLDDLWETEQVDELYNQSSFMLAKIVPTTYHRITTMGTASVWNLLLTTWSYENNLAIPIPDKKENFSGGLARCYRRGYSEDIIKIDYASLYPMIQLTHNIFPIFDITGVIKKMLLYLTTTRNIYKKIGNGDVLNDEELLLLKNIDYDIFDKYSKGELIEYDILMAKIKQLPIKILNNSLFGALGSDISFNWSDNISAARITCIGRLELRHAISWFSEFGCVALLAVTDGINFKIPKLTNIKVSNNIVTECDYMGSVDEMWVYKDKVGIEALILKFNEEEMIPPYMSVDNDGRSESCLNLSRINYANLKLKKNKKTGEFEKKITLTGNTIKSKTMPGYVEEFIDVGLNLILNGNGKGFVEYYNSYVQDLYNMRIPLKKIASKSKIKTTISEYLKRGTDKNGKPKAKQAHMELLIDERKKIAINLLNEHNEKIKFRGDINELDYDSLMRLVKDYLPPERELDSYVYYVNIGTRASHGDSKPNSNSESGISCLMIKTEDLLENPNMLGMYNIDKYISAFNKRVNSILVGFKPDVANRILAKIKRKKVKNEFGAKEDVVELITSMFTEDELMLDSFELDNFDDSMFLEKKEVYFWNAYGYDPRLIWNGFKCHENSKVYYDIYENALKYLNEIMEKNGKHKIKSINEKYDVNDYVLLKNKNTYSLMKFNGKYLETIRESVDVPKCESQIELDEIGIFNIKKIQDDLESGDVETAKYFKLFKERFEIPVGVGMDDLFKSVPESVSAFSDFIDEMKGEFFDDDFDGDYE